MNFKIPFLKMSVIVMMLITFQLHAENIYFTHTTCNFEIEKSDHASTASMMVDKIDLESFSATCGVSNILANLIGDADETSGFTYNPDTETFFAVADAFLNNTGPGELYEINLNGELERIIVLNNFFGGSELLVSCSMVSKDDNSIQLWSIQSLKLTSYE
jgi:uncharacterized protein YjiK